MLYGEFFFGDSSEIGRYHMYGSAQLSMKFQLLINVKIDKTSGKFRFKTQKLAICPAHKC